MYIYVLFNYTNFACSSEEENRKIEFTINTYLNYFCFILCFFLLFRQLKNNNLVPFFLYYLAILHEFCFLSIENLRYID